nr:CRISPR-associated endonuclease Cas2 [Candidatus Sigynarchaeum springense]
MFWVITYDVPVTHDKWREKLAKVLSDFGFFRIQYSVFVGDRTTNTTQACKLKIEAMLKAGFVPADVRFFPLCKSCEAGAIQVNNCNYKSVNAKTGVPSTVLIT